MTRLLPILLLLVSCGADEPPVESEPRERVRGPGEPRRVFLDRIFLSFRGSPSGVESRRSREDTALLARRLLQRAREGESFAELREGYSDDRSEIGDKANGPYILMNYGVDIAPTLIHVPRMLREAMGPRLGDVAFGMQVGDVELIEQDDAAYPAGFEIIRCLQRDDRTEAEVAADLRKPGR